jgi:hypothetical protein
MTKAALLYAHMKAATTLTALVMTHHLVATALRIASPEIIAAGWASIQSAWL